MARKRTTYTLSENMINKATRPTDKPYKDLWDKKQTGLFIRITKTKKVFYCYDGRARKTTKIADWGVINANGLGVETARMRAREIISHSAPITDVGRMTLGQYLDRAYVDDRNALKMRPVRPLTIKKIKGNFPDWLDLPIKRITNRMLLDKVSLWRAGEHTIDTSHPSQRHRTPKPNTESTIRKKFVEINAVFNTLERRKHIAKNPLEHLNIKKDSVPEHIHVYSQDTVKYEDVMDFVLNQDRPVTEKTSKYRKGHTRAARVLIATIIRLGLRDAEARNNYVYNFHLNTVHDSHLVIPGSITKTGKGRKVPIDDPVLLDALIGYKDHYQVKNEQGLMFYNPRTGKAYTDALGRSLYDEVKEEFGLGKNGNGSGRKYDFRHTFATRLYHATGNIKAVADAIGDELQTTDDYYAQDNMKAIRTGMAKLK